jgi:hypothetical protein
MKIVEMRNTSQSFLQWLGYTPGYDYSDGPGRESQLGELLFTSAWLTVITSTGEQLSFCRYREVDL